MIRYSVDELCQAFVGCLNTAYEGLQSDDLRESLATVVVLQRHGSELAPRFKWWLKVLRDEEMKRKIQTLLDVIAKSQTDRAEAVPGSGEERHEQ